MSHISSRKNLLLNSPPLTFYLQPSQRDSIASSVGNISTASTDSDERKRMIKKQSSASSGSRRTIISECNVNVTPERDYMEDDNDVSYTSLRWSV